MCIGLTRRAIPPILIPHAAGFNVGRIRPRDPCDRCVL